MTEIEDMDDAELADEVMDLTAEVVELVKLLRGSSSGHNVVEDGSIERHGVGGWNR
jgi:hypothetical protein